MIAADGRWEVLYLKGESRSTTPVVAWSDDGAPLIVDLSSNQLQDAREAPGFFSLVEANDLPYVMAVPGNGWMVEHDAPDGGTERRHVVAWAIDSGGRTLPVTIWGLEASPEERTPSFRRLIPPTETDQGR